VTPELARRLVEGSGVRVLVQPSARRVFRDKDYVRAGAEISTDLSEAGLILGVKEIPPEAVCEGTTYLFFSHVIKGQPHNMAMLARLMELGCTLIDYESITDDDGQRLVFFGRFAGLAGMIDTLWALGQRLEHEGLQTPFAALQPAHTYASLEEATEAVRTAGNVLASEGLPEPLTPLVIGIAGYGNVANGVREMLSELPTRELTPEELPGISADDFVHCVAQVTFREEHMVRPAAADGVFDLDHYYQYPKEYCGAFGHNLKHISVLMNCTYWDDRYPRLVTKDELRDLFAGPDRPSLRVIGDLGCDVGGAVECTMKCTQPGDPIYVWDPDSDSISSGVEGKGPVVLAVDILPSELPREASEEFSEALAHHLPVLARVDFGTSFERLDLPQELKRAVVVHRGELTPDYRYLESHLPA
jgi:alpha-aminoadipic semialdehyde synthase